LPANGAVNALWTTDRVEVTIAAVTTAGLSRIPLHPTVRAVEAAV
jgi:hypothetical protein